MGKKCILILIVVLLFSCSKKTNNENNITENINNENVVIVESDIDDCFSSIDEIETAKSDITGRYVFHSINMIKEYGIDNIKEFNAGIDEVYFDIEHISDDNYILKYHDPQGLMFYNIDISFKYPKNDYYHYSAFTSRYDGIPFLSMHGDMGLGGTYHYFYYEESQIIIDYLDFIYHITGIKEDGDPETELGKWFEFNIVFQKETD